MYTTYCSTFVSIALIVLMAINLVELSLAFQDGTKQIEKTTREQFDRYSSEAYYLTQNSFEIAAFVSKGAERVNKDLDGYNNEFFNVYQRHPCEFDEKGCQGGEFVATLGQCSSEKRQEILNFQEKVHGKELA